MVSASTIICNPSLRLAIAALLLMVGAAQAATVNINATEDATVVQAAPTTNAGTDKELAVGTGGTGMSFRFYLNFSNLTALHGKLITDARINLTINRSASGGHAEVIDIYRLFNTSWSENTTTWDNQPNTNNTNHTSDLFALNSSDFPALNYALFDVRQAIGYAAARNQTSIGFIFVRGTTTNNKITYFNSLNNGSAQAPRLEVVYEDVQNYTISIDTSDRLLHNFGMGLSYYYSGGTGDQANITAGLRDIGGHTFLLIQRWDIFEPSNSTPANLSTQNWTGYRWENGREDEYYGGEWHNFTWLGALQAAKNVDPSDPPTVIIRLAFPPSWIQAAGVSPKWYPLKSDFYTDAYYTWWMIALMVTQNASYPADKIIFDPVNEPYGNTNTGVWTYANRLSSYGEMIRAAKNAANAVDPGIRVAALDDNDPTLGLTADFFTNNASYAAYIDILSFHNYLHGDIGYAAWNSDFTPRDNPYSREWELIYQPYMVATARSLANANNIDQVWLTENNDKYLAHNDAGSACDIKILNTTNDALWWAARWSVLSQQDWNVTLPWTLIPLRDVNDNNGNTTACAGWGFMESYQRDWVRYEVYNVSKMYDNYAGRAGIINISNTTLYDNYIFVGAFTSNRRIDVFITNFRNTSSNASLNITHPPFDVKIRRVYTLLNATKTEDTRFSDTSFNYVIPANSAYLIEMEGGALPDYSSSYIVAGTAGLSAALYLAYRRRQRR